jgi:hypothetical protein
VRYLTPEELEMELEEYPPGMCEKNEEVNEAVEYISTRVSISNERRLFNYGRSQVETFGGVTLDDLLDQALRIAASETTIMENSECRGGETNRYDEHRYRWNRRI